MVTSQLKMSHNQEGSSSYAEECLSEEVDCSRPIEHEEEFDPYHHIFSISRRLEESGLMPPEDAKQFRQLANKLQRNNFRRTTK